MVVVPLPAGHSLTKERDVMKRFVRRFVRRSAWYLIPASRAKRIEEYAVPAGATSFYTAVESEPVPQALSTTEREPAPTGTTKRMTGGMHVQKILSGFALWFGLLFSAALLGTFLIVAIAILYGLLMSGTGH
jgi:hypothetical protein